MAKINEHFHVDKKGRVRRNPGKRMVGRIKRTKKGLIFIAHKNGRTYMKKIPARMKRR